MVHIPAKTNIVFLWQGRSPAVRVPGRRQNWHATDPMGEERGMEYFGI